MKNIILLRPVSLVVGTLLVFPTLCFIISTWLNYTFEIHGLWKAIEPIFASSEQKELRLDINLLMLLAPLLAIMINLPQVVHLHSSQGDDQLYIYLTLESDLYSWLIVATGIACVVVLFFYLLAENCIW